MFVNIVKFPKKRDRKDTEFRQWFTDSNRAYASHLGFIRRVLLQPREAGGNYAALVEHEGYGSASSPCLTEIHDPSSMMR